jgi:hypothetical protein
VRLLEEEKVLDIIERVTNDAIEKKKHKATIQKSLIYEISLLASVEGELVRHGRIEPMTDEEVRSFVVDKGMPVFNSLCCSCGAMCFNDDTYCAECGTKLDEE